MSNILTIFIDTTTFSILVSLFTVGVGALSQEGALLYPLRLFVERWSSGNTAYRLDNILRYQNKRRQSRQAAEWIEPAIEKLRMSLFWKNAWHKPLFTCSMCMPSVWSTIIYWSMFYNYPIAVWLLGAPIAVSIVLIINKIKKQ